MNLQESIETLEKEIEIRKRQIQYMREQQRQCQHQFGEILETFEIEKEPQYENEPKGSDFFNPVFIGMKDKKVKVYTRICEKCGLVQKTRKTNSVKSVKYSPDFS